ncbi:MAG: GNAT family N-acetyltransferase [Planctomycetes bacterium]|nr:GNAT family N-acetyltransferase [Planctomycetota bacterium]
MDIRPMTEDDVAEVAALLRACFGWLADREGFTAEQRAFLVGPRSSAETIRTESKTRPHLVACQGGAIVGFVTVNGRQIARLYVHPRYHRQGVGKALFEAAEAMIRAAGHGEMIVGALVDDAVAFYRAMGMSVAGHELYEPHIFLGRRVTLLAKNLLRSESRTR